MTSPNADVLRPGEMGELNVVFGSGGSKAVLAGAGAIIALQLAGLKHFATIGGASGGSIPAAFLASGADATQILSHALQTDFTSLLTPKKGKLGQLLALLMKYRFEQTRPENGVFSSEKLGAFVTSVSKTWPEKYWTVASAKFGFALFTKDGVHRMGVGIKPLHVQNEPVPVGMAVRASCAIPGVIDAVEFQGEPLWDGAFTEFGECPVDLPPAYFGAKKSDIFAIDISEEIIKKNRWLRILFHIFCGGKCVSIDAVHPEEKDGLMLAQPMIKGFHAMEFQLNLDQKWHAVVEGLISTVDALERGKRIPAENREALLRLRNDLAAIDIKSIRKRCFARQVEGVFLKEAPHILP
ncbi:MAG: hypothetical protein C0507_08250 [Cyanobacteria bacterium PR.3.49]|nr:hypothetical protein [Cyanobacteria bacterium PR.3.49]